MESTSISQEIIFVVYQKNDGYFQPIYSSQAFTNVNALLRRLFIASEYNTGDKSDEMKFYSNYNIKKTTKEALDKLVNSNEIYDRKEAAMAGYKLEQLINDDDWRVRWEVANHGYGLDRLANDENVDVRCVAALKGNNTILAILVSDDNETVRDIVAKRGYGLDMLKQDSSENVRNAAVQKERLLKSRLPRTPVLSIG